MRNDNPLRTDWTLNMNTSRSKGHHVVRRLRNTVERLTTKNVSKNKSIASISGFEKSEISAMGTVCPCMKAVITSPVVPGDVSRDFLSRTVSDELSSWWSADINAEDSTGSTEAPFTYHDAMRIRRRVDGFPG